MSAVACGLPAEGHDDRGDADLSAVDLALLASLPQRLRIVEARSPLTRDSFPSRAQCADEPELSAAAQRVWDAEKGSARALAERYRAVAELYTVEMPDDPQGGLADDLDTLRAALALRVTHGVADWELRSAHHAVHHFPRCLDLLASGRLASWWFQRMLRESQHLGDESRRQMDVAIAAWSTDIPADRFVTLLNSLIQLMEKREVEPDEPPAPPVRRITLSPATTGGIGSATMQGPVPEVLAYWKRLDESARAIQAAQRKALREGVEIPYDIDGIVSETGRPVPLGRLQYELQLNAEFDTDGVVVPPGRFRLNVTVPVLTLLGVSDAPGMVDGTTPIPPEMARELAGREDTWYRVLTDPCHGAFLPVPAERYTPSQAMLEHLRLRNSRCAVPGCSRSVSWASECDHIEEYDHQHPAGGGQTEIENLHLLCWQHHLEKTLGLLDPLRLPSPDRGPGRTRWRIGADGDHVIVADDIDLATRIAVQQLEHAWEVHSSRRRMAARPPDSEPTADGTVEPPPPIPLRPEIPPGPWDPDDPPPF